MPMIGHGLPGSTEDQVTEVLSIRLMAPIQSERADELLQVDEAYQVLQATIF